LVAVGLQFDALFNATKQIAAGTRF